MPNNIDIEQGKVSSHSSNISSSASSMQVQSLSAVDSVSTIAGNELCKQAFAESQNMIAQLVASLQAEAKKIQTLGNEFDNVDNQLASMVSSLGGK